MQLMYASFMMQRLGSLGSLLILRAYVVDAFTLSEPRQLRPSLRAHTTKLLQVQNPDNFEAYNGQGKAMGPSEKDWTAKGPATGDGPPTSYHKPYDACLGCIRFNPAIKLEPGDGEENDGPAPDECRFGPCDFRDPQTQPWGGVIGFGSEADPSNGYDGRSGFYKGPEPLVCFTLNDVSWYNNCDDLLYKDAANVVQVSNACEYREQVNVLGPFLGHKEAFVRLGDHRKSENCAAVIENGWTLYDDKDSFNSDLEALHACCETVHQYFTCVGDRKDILMGDHTGLMHLDDVANHTVKHFALYCVPMYVYPTKPKFCGEFPTSDPCVEYHGCKPCTEHGGVWCPDQKTCTKNGDPWCVRDPNKCDVPFPPKPAPPAPAPPPPPELPSPGHPDWYWEIVRAARLTNKTDIAVPYWTETNVSKWTSNYYINDAPSLGDPERIQLVKQGKPVLFGPHAVKAWDKKGGGTPWAANAGMKDSHSTGPNGLFPNSTHGTNGLSPNSYNVSFSAGTPPPNFNSNFNWNSVWGGAKKKK